MCNESEPKKPTATTSDKSNKRPQIVLLTVTVAVIVNILFSNQWSCAILPVGIVAVIAALFVRFFSGRKTGQNRVAHTRALLLLAIIIGTAIGLAVRVNPRWAFHEAFGFEMPAEIRDFQVLARHYEGGPGEHSLFLQFHAEQTVVESLITKAEFNNDTSRVTEWREYGATWASIPSYFLHSGPLGYSQRTWDNIEPMVKPQLYTGKVINGWTIVLYEADSDRVIAIHTRF